MKYINEDFFLITLGLVFSLPNAGDIFLQYIAPIIQKDSTPTISFLIFIIWILVSFGAIFAIINLIRKYNKMRGIVNNNHIRNIIIGIVLGAIVGGVLDKILF